MRTRKLSATILAALVTAGLAGLPAGAAPPPTSWTYTTNADFEQGSLNNVVDTIVADQLQLDETTSAFPFIWVALSDRGTIAKIDTATGQVKGEYSTTSDGDDAHSPSRTTVATDGSVWAGNRYQSSVIHVGNLEAGGCVDRNGNGTIETSTGYDDVKAWPGGSSGTSAPASAAEDECILHYIDTPGGDARHLSVDKNGDVWVGSYFGGPTFQLLNGSTGAVMRTETMPCGGYGGLIDGNGILWSSQSGTSLLRWDPSTDASTAQCISKPGIYGLAFDSQNNIWASTYGSGIVYKVGPEGQDLGSFPMGHPYAQGLAVDGNDHVWISSSLNGGANQISHLLNDGTLVGQVTGAGDGSTGVSVDAAGKIWTANLESSDATRIDPQAGPVGAGGANVGAFDLTVPLPGAKPYNYSDMTGSTLIGAPKSGTWTIVVDSTVAGTEWGKLGWNAEIPGDSGLTFTVASSTDNVTFSPAVVVTAQDTDVDVPDGQYLRVTVAFTRATTGESPILQDLTVKVANEAPDCTQATPSLDSIWPVNHKFVPVEVSGVTDPDGDPITITIDSIKQDEPVDTNGDGSFTPDGQGVGTATAEVRAERSGTPKVPGDGRVYHIGFTASDGQGGTCTSEVLVNVPHDQNKPAVDGGALYDSTVN